jgi:hypothetical protein
LPSTTPELVLARYTSDPTGGPVTVAEPLAGIITAVETALAVCALPLLAM